MKQHKKPRQSPRFLFLKQKMYEILPIVIYMEKHILSKRFFFLCALQEKWNQDDFKSGEENVL